MIILVAVISSWDAQENGTMPYQKAVTSHFFLKLHCCRDSTDLYFHRHADVAQHSYKAFFVEARYGLDHLRLGTDMTSEQTS